MRRLIAILCLLAAFGVRAECIVSGDTTTGIYFYAVDANDKITPETGLTSFTVYRTRNGGTPAAFTSPTVTELDGSNMPGWYFLLIDEDTTISSGKDREYMGLHITHAGMQPVPREICIERPKITVGETLAVSSGAVGTVSTVSGDVGGIAAGGLTLDAFNIDTNPLFGILRRGTAQSATSTGLVLDSEAPFGDNAINGATLWGCGSTQGYCQSQVITDYEGSSATATVDTWPVTPSGTITYFAFGTAPGGAGSAPSAEEIAEAVASQPLTVGTVNDKTGYSLASSQTFNNSGTWTGNISGNVTGSVGSVTGNVGGTVTGLEGMLTTIASYIDTEVAAILAVAEKLDDTLEDNSGTFRFTEAALAQAPAGEGGGGGGADAEEIAEAVALELGTGSQFTSITGAIGDLNDLSAEDVQSAAEAAIDAKQAGLVEAMWRYIIDPASNTEARCAMAALLSFSSGDFTTSANTTTFEDATGTSTRLVMVVGPDSRSVTITCPSY